MFTNWVTNDNLYVSRLLATFLSFFSTVDWLVNRYNSSQTFYWQRVTPLVLKVDHTSPPPPSGTPCWPLVLLEMDYYCLCCQSCVICSLFSMPVLSCSKRNVYPSYKHGKPYFISNFPILLYFRYLTYTNMSYIWRYWILPITLFKSISS